MADRTSTTNCTRPASTAGTTASARGKSSPDALELHPVDGLFVQHVGNPSNDYSGRPVGPCQALCDDSRDRSRSAVIGSSPSTGRCRHAAPVHNCKYRRLHAPATTFLLSFQ